MSFGANSRVRELMADDRAKAVVEKYLPGASSHPQLPMAMDMTLKELSWYPEAGLSQDKLKAIVADLETIE